MHSWILLKFSSVSGSIMSLLGLISVSPNITVYWHTQKKAYNVNQIVDKKIIQISKPFSSKNYSYGNIKISIIPISF